MLRQATVAGPVMAWVQPDRCRHCNQSYNFARERIAGYACQTSSLFLGWHDLHAEECVCTLVWW